MKKTILVLGSAMLLFAGSLTVTSCGNGSTSTEMKKSTEQYQCPMKCEGDKTYDSQVDCPKCGMATQKVGGHAEHNH